MESRLSKDTFCGVLGMEDKENSGEFVRRLVCLDTSASKLNYFHENEANERDVRSSREPDGNFNVCFLSMTADAASLRPKIPHCFYIIVSGRKHYFQASSENEKQLWIEKLQDASRIMVPQHGSIVDSAETGFKVEVVGGVVLKTPIDCFPDATDDIDSDDSVHRSSSPSQHIEEEPIKTGYCTKQGLFRKSWKRRYFILSSSAFRYCRSMEDRTPIRIIKVLDILEVRPSIGIHLNRENVFEVVTQNRVFYVQAESEIDRDSWLLAITRCMQMARGPKVLVTSI